jgi:mono/diheme cytochrome c family protein
VKSFALPDTRKWIETRFFTKQGGEWFGYSYVWNEAGTDAELVPAGGMDREFTVEGRKQVWRYPSRAECMVCHSRAQNFVLGLCTEQMNRDHDYGGGRTDNQLRTLDHIGMLKVDWAAEAKAALGKWAAAKGRPARPDPAAVCDLLPKLVDPYDPKQDLTRRARSWLHANCSACHVEAGGGNARMELEFATAIDKMRVLREPPLHTTFDLPDARLIAPGHPDRSVIVKRAGTRGPGQMPPLASSRVDEAGVALLREWVAAMTE